MRGLLIGLPISAALWVVGLCLYARAAGPGGESAVDLSAYQTKAEASAAISAMQSAMAAAASNASTKLDAVPTTGPGPGKCRFAVVPSNLIQSGGVTGTPGTCSRIVQCGTSGTYVVAQFNIGDGC